MPQCQSDNQVALRPLELKVSSPHIISHDDDALRTGQKWCQEQTRAWGVVNKQGGGIRFVDAKFTKPVKVGETVTATGKVKRKHHTGQARTGFRSRSRQRTPRAT